MNGNIQYVNPVNVASTIPISQPMPQSVGQTVGYAGGIPSGVAYRADQTQFAYPNSGVQGGIPATMQPTSQRAEVGFMDKMKSYFQDVYRSDDNLGAYKNFQNEVDNNPAYLKPGSSNRQRVIELQQQLNIVGINANINGTYGYATGEAVKEFKNMVGMNDGFLDGDGKPAVTDIATPQMFNVLSSMVNQKLNPTQPGTGNPLPVTQQELNWAMDLQNKIKNFGYRPTKQEYDKYQDIFTRHQNNGGGPVSQPQQPVYQPPVVQPQPPVYQPPAPVVNQPPAVVPNQPVYQPPVTQPQQPVYTPPVNTPTAPVYETPATTLVTQQEMDWALRLQNQIEYSGYRPSVDEAQRYNDIFSRYQQQQLQATLPTGPVTQQEMDWAVAMQNRIETQGYRPTTEEAAKYENIFNRYQTQPQNPGQTQTTPGANPTVQETVTQQEMAWALDLQNRIETQNYQPTQEEILRYTDIFNRANAQPQPQTQPTEPTQPTQTQPTEPAPHPGASAQEVQWARELEIKMTQQGYQPSQQEISQYNNIQMKLALHGVAPSAPATTTPTQPTTQVQQAGGLTQADIDWAIQLQQRVQLQGYQPTQAEIDRYTAIFQQLQQQETPQTQPTQPQAPQPTYQTQPTQQTQPNTGPPTAEELAWANQLMQMVQQNGYQATPQEMAQYTDIFTRYQQSQQQQQPVQQPTYQQQPVQQPQQQPATPGMVNINLNSADPELQWALQLLERFKQGYQATAQEIALYEQIISRQAVPYMTP